MPDTTKPDAVNAIGYVEGLAIAAKSVSVSNQAILAVNRYREAKNTEETKLAFDGLKANLKQQIEEDANTDAALQKMLFGDGKVPPEADANAAGAGNGGLLPEANGDAGAGNGEIPVNENAQLAPGVVDPAASQDLLNSDSSMLDGDCFGGIFALTQVDCRRILQSKPRTANEMYSVWEKIQSKQSKLDLKYDERPNTRRRKRRSLSADPTLGDGNLWKSVCQSNTFKSDYQGMGFIENRKGGKTSLMSFLTDSSQTVTFSADGGIEMEYTSTVSDEMTFSSDAGLTSENSKRENHERVAGELTEYDKREKAHKEIGELKFKMGKSQKQEHKATRTVKITLDDENDGLYLCCLVNTFLSLFRILICIYVSCL